jgi:cob(I)alamin adenosyltransferase
MTGLFGTKKRFPKSASIYDALGTLDELNSLLGVCTARCRAEKRTTLDIAEAIQNVQQCLFVAQAELAGAQKSITQGQIDTLEHIIDTIEGVAGNPHAFVISGATELSGLLDYARAVSRRAERAVLKSRAALSPTTRTYLNRLSSLLYALARSATARAGITEISPSY